MTEQAHWTIEYHELPSGQCPTADYLDSLSSEQRAVMEYRIDLLEEHGLDLDYPHTQYLRDHISELRGKHRRVQLRIHYFVFQRTTFVLLLGENKEKKRRQQECIDRAIEYRWDYLDRKQRGEL